MTLWGGRAQSCGGLGGNRGIYKRPKNKGMLDTNGRARKCCGGSLSFEIAKGPKLYSAEMSCCGNGGLGALGGGGTGAECIS